MTTPQQVTTDRQRNWFARHKILSVLMAFAVVVIVIAAMNSGPRETAETTSGSGGPAAATAEPANEKPDRSDAAPGLGAPVRDGKFEFTVTGVQAGVPTVGEEYLTETAQGEYVLVTMTVRNIGDQAQSFAASAQKLLDGQSRQFSADDMATIVFDQNISYEQINPGNAIEATVVFDVPVGTVPMEIELHDSLFSGGT
ncbi:MAG: DUF4352 domain-containing protein, partial [Rhodococcus sp. (in: high G+C Gram-positive bacteria)]